MSKIWEPLGIHIYNEWVDKIWVAWDENEMHDADPLLNEWEYKFITSLSERLNAGRNLTQAQAEKLESIYSEKTK